MNQPYIKPIFLAYITIMTLLAFFSKDSSVKADEINVEEEIVEVSETVYELEMNHANFDQIKTDVLSDDIKYIMTPSELQSDIKLSEVIAKDIDYASFEEQEVLVDVVRYTDSNSEKQVVDIIEEKVLVKFVDTTKPELTLSKSSIEFEEGKSFDAKKYIKDVSDNSFTEVEVDIEDPVDNEKPGEYEVVYTARDASNNTTSETLTVTVTKKPEPVVEKPKAAVARTPRVSAPVYTASGDAVSQTLSLINQHRAARGLHALQLAPAAEMNAAAIRAAEANGYVSHTRPDGRSYRTAFTDAGLNHSNVIEVLVYSGNSPQDKVNWWMNSGTHSRVLMRSDITHIAIGINGKMYSGIVYK